MFKTFSKKQMHKPESNNKIHNKKAEEIRIDEEETH